MPWPANITFEVLRLPVICVFYRTAWQRFEDILPVWEDLHKNREGASNWSTIAKAIEKLGIYAKELHSSKEPLVIFFLLKYLY